MILLNSLFTSIYTFLKYLEGGFSNQTDGARANESIVFVSGFLTFNVLSIWPRLLENSFSFWFFLVSFIITNGLIFYKVQDYKSVVSRKLNNTFIGYILSACYVIGTILVFIKIKDLF